MSTSFFVAADWLAEHIDDPEIQIIDARMAPAGQEAACTGCLPTRGWWWRSILRTGGWICVPRRYRMSMTMKSWRGSATAGASATTAISPPPLSSALASPRGNTASAVANYLRSHWPFNPWTYSPGCARATSFCPAIFATSSTGRLLSSASCW